MSLTGHSNKDRAGSHGIEGSHKLEDIMRFALAQLGGHFAPLVVVHAGCKGEDAVETEQKAVEVLTTARRLGGGGTDCVPIAYWKAAASKLLGFISLGSAPGFRGGMAAWINLQVRIALSISWWLCVSY